MYNENIKVKEYLGKSLRAGIVGKVVRKEETRSEETLKAIWVWRSGWNLPH